MHGSALLAMSRLRDVHDNLRENSSDRLGRGGKKVSKAGVAFIICRAAKIKEPWSLHKQEHRDTTSS